MGESRRAFNVQNFTATLNKTGVAHASHFEVQITGQLAQAQNKI